MNSASFTTPVAPEALASAFGSNLATVSASGGDTDPNTPGIQLPTTLNGTTVQVRDSAGTIRLAPLTFVSGSQVNYQIPSGTQIGTADVTISSPGNISTGSVQIASTAPGLFTANSAGTGLASGTWQRYNSAGQLIVPDQLLTTAIDFGQPGDIVFLILYGTGIRFRSSLSAVTASIGGQAGSVEYAGAQGSFVGLDQINIRLPRTLAGSGSNVPVVLTVDGHAANTVTVNIQ